MRHFVQYRNPRKTGTAHPDRDAFRVFTNKDVAARAGDKVWVIAGEGTPRAYSLIYWFLVDGCGPAPAPRYRFSVHGSVGERFVDPPIHLNAYPWWEEFRRAQGNFAFGLNALKVHDVARLEELARSYTDGYRNSVGAIMRKDNRPS